jgi:hypothetical protein
VVLPSLSSRRRVPPGRVASWLCCQTYANDVKRAPAIQSHLVQLHPRRVGYSFGVRNDSPTRACGWQRRETPCRGDSPAERDAGV